MDKRWITIALGLLGILGLFGEPTLLCIWVFLITVVLALQTPQK